jgi:hypothetical protein
MIKYFIKICAMITLAVVFLLEQLTSLDKVSVANAGMQTPAGQSAKQFNQEQALAELRKKIAGHENKPAEEVFKNIQLLKGVPAARVLAIMVVAYSKSLGVDCTHCHTPDQWERDDLPTKRVTREMAMMVRAINNEYLKKIRNLKSENPVVNCTTCHRGQTKPALNLP